MTDVLQFVAAEGPLGGHLWHIVLLGSWFPIFGLTILFEKTSARRRARRLGFDNEEHSGVFSTTIGATTSTACRSTWLQLIALTSFSAALVHAAVMPDHFEQSLIYGYFFLIASLSQLIFGALILIHPSRQLVKAGITASALMIVLWLVSRTLGVPIGPDNGGTEPFGLLDTLASTYEAALIIFGVLALRSGIPTPTWRWSKWAPMMRFVAPLCIVGAMAASVISSRS